MILFISFITLSLLFISLAFMFNDHGEFWALFIIFLFLTAFSFLFKIGNRLPEKDKICLLQEKYAIAIGDSASFSLKSEIYTDCLYFNNSLNNAKKFHDSSFVGFYYSEVPTGVILFDLTKIK